MKNDLIVTASILALLGLAACNGAADTNPEAIETEEHGITQQGLDSGYFKLQDVRSGNCVTEQPNGGVTLEACSNAASQKLQMIDITRTKSYPKRLAGNGPSGPSYYPAYTETYQGRLARFANGNCLDTSSAVLKNGYPLLIARACDKSELTLRRKSAEELVVYRKRVIALSGGASLANGPYEVVSGCMTALSATSVGFDYSGYGCYYAPDSAQFRSIPATLFDE